MNDDATHQRDVPRSLPSERTPLSFVDGEHDASGWSLSSTAAVFVGRERELRVLCAGLETMGRGKTSVFLLSGEPGIGKTRLASEFAAIAEHRGLQVRWGRCWEAGGAPTYWPWIEAARACLRGSDGDALARRVTAQWSHLGVLIPELYDRFAGVPETEPTADPDRARFQLFDGMTSFLRAVAELQPLMIVLDDLHAADHSSLLMLQFVARQLRDVPLVLVGCYRDTEIRSAPEIGKVLGEIGREGQQLALHGLDDRNIARFMSTVCRSPATADVVTAVRTITAGNPFFVGEVVGELVANGDGARRVPLPAGVREAVRSRLRQLSGSCIEILTLAAVVGQEFAMPALASMAKKTPDEVAGILEEACDARLIAERAGALGHYVFSHGLIREALYEDLPATRRAELHGCVGAALERLCGADDEAHLATLAHHFFMAAPYGEAMKAIAFCRRAAERALRQCGAPEAVEHYARALQVVTLAGGDTARQRCQLLIGRGRALEHVGDFQAARRDFAEAAAIARHVDDREALASAALGCGEQWALKFTCSLIDKSDVALLEEALRVTSVDHPSVRAALLARMGLALFFTGTSERSADVSATAVELARELGSDDALARALSARHAVLLGPEGLAERFAIVEEIHRIGHATGNREVQLRSHVLRLYDLVERGDVDAGGSEISHIVRLSNDIGDQFERWHCTLSQAAAALFHGHIVESERLAEHAYREAHRVPGQQRSDENAGQCFLLQIAMVRREQARVDELPPEVWALADKHSPILAWRAVGAVLELDLGRTQDAAHRFGDLGTRDLSTIPRDSVWTGTMFLLAELFTRLGDRARCRQVFELLKPHPELNATLASPLWLGGSMRALAMLAGTLGSWDDAEALFERAVAWHAQKGAWLWLGHTQVDYAAMLLDRRGSGDAERATALLEAARVAAESYEAARLAQRVERMQSQLPPVARPRPTLTDDARQKIGRAVFRREGEYWTLIKGDRTARVRNSRGMVMLSYLLAHPGREMHAADLVLVANPPPPTERPPIGEDGVVFRGESVAPHLDATARREYRERLTHLRAELAEANRQHDVYRATLMESEIHKLAAELQRDMGMGHRRRSGSDAERARLNATRAIRSALVRIEEAHPALGGHLRLAVRTGTFCAYVPDPTFVLAWDA